MKIRQSGISSDSDVTLEMTPMIDVVFLLLIFFMLTFKIVSVEGQFSINMPKAEGAQADPTLDVSTALPDIRLRLVADLEDGSLEAILVDDDPIGSFEELGPILMGMTGGDPEMAADIAIQLRADPQLHYGHVIQAINEAARARITQIKFEPPTDPGLDLGIPDLGL